MMNCWENISSALFFFPKEQIVDAMKLKMMIDEFLPNLRSREIILFAERKLDKNSTETSIKSVTIYSEKEFNFLGKTKNADLLKVFEKNYHSVFIFGTLPKKGMKLLNGLKINQLIGVNSENDLLEIKLSTNSSEPSEMLNFVKNTLSKINFK